jgi:hypothetical protein
MAQSFKKYTNKKQDGRVKLPPEKHNEVREFYAICKSQRKTAFEFGVSRRLVQFILNPTSLQAMQEKNRKEQHWKTYYNKEYHTAAIAKYRQKKKALGLSFNPNSTTHE